MDIDDAEDDVFVNEGIVFENKLSQEGSLDFEEGFFSFNEALSLEIDGEGEERREDKRIKKQSSTIEDIESFVQEEVLMKEIHESSVIHGLNNYINNSLESWEFKSINVAITGNSGSGKSSLINALRGLTPKSVGAAKVGLKETTTQANKYKFPESNRVSLWDLPGVGTQQFPKESYLDEFELSKFDIVVIVTASRFLENDIWIAKHAVGLEKCVLFVRTKLDLDLLNAKRDDPDNFDEACSIATIRKDMEDNVNTIGFEELDDSIFIISSPERNKYDFPILCSKLKSLMNSTGEGICKLLLDLIEKAVEEKREAVRGKFIGKRIVSAIYGALPIPKLETTCGISTARDIREICLKAFSLDEASLEKISTEVDISVHELKTFHLKSFNTEQLNDMEQLYTETEENRYSTFRKYSKYLVPVAGSVMSACKSAQVIRDCQNIISGIMADDEFRLVQLRLLRLERQLRPLK